MFYVFFIGCKVELYSLEADSDLTIGNTRNIESVLLNNNLAVKDQRNE